ncbi:hypothetical protein XENOCAPTIV_022122 [Xenoophorus captivus]|uniref:Uncharacterized protein n=1 Tax=Xenoophorus captivus TaxID=1517983 RepID=A0ABV0S521_9TELE
MGYPVGRTSSILAGVFLAVAAGVSPRVSRVQQVVEGQVRNRQALPAHESSPQQLDQTPPDGLQQGAQVVAQQQRLELEAEVSLIVFFLALVQKVNELAVYG